jgi:uncharacterized membrane protein YhaH (DUF805 family)
MIDSIRYSLQNYANFSGRATRKEFWSFYLFFIVSAIIGGFIDGLMGTDFVGNVIGIALLVPYIAVAIRRMHDVNKSGWFILVPIYNLVLFLTASKYESGEPSI